MLNLSRYSVLTFLKDAGFRIELMDMQLSQPSAQSRMWHNLQFSPSLLRWVERHPYAEDGTHPICVTWVKDREWVSSRTGRSVSWHLSKLLIEFEHFGVDAFRHARKKTQNHLTSALRGSIEDHVKYLQDRFKKLGDGVSGAVRYLCRMRITKPPGCFVTDGMRWAWWLWGLNGWFTMRRFQQNRACAFCFRIPVDQGRFSWQDERGPLEGRCRGAKDSIAHFKECPSITWWAIRAGFIPRVQTAEPSTGRPTQKGWYQCYSDGQFGRSEWKFDSEFKLSYEEWSVVEFCRFIHTLYRVHNHLRHHGGHVERLQHGQELLDAFLQGYRHARGRKKIRTKRKKPPSKGKGGKGNNDGKGKRVGGGCNDSSDSDSDDLDDNDPLAAGPGPGTTTSVGYEYIGRDVSDIHSNSTGVRPGGSSDGVCNGATRSCFLQSQFLISFRFRKPPMGLRQVTDAHILWSFPLNFQRVLLRRPWIASLMPPPN